ncbi:hypothetical protein CROQUDRAFT_720387 [Cronartium quercuum f. sp. fusiforme G11]|uniref:Uncharacterized protein n=1 Tax=Cronartium quercuum f. sp. fusiforme G11 TaxID=708437 RepID=A0A9P6NS73_9BASI|nr:hypothetical protein CROQUDRAFT_720387 [Cronartium quercuum f. sp. fusiforme G11]
MKISSVLIIMAICVLGIYASLEELRKEWDAGTAKANGLKTLIEKNDYNPELPKLETQLLQLRTKNEELGNAILKLTAERKKKRAEKANAADEAKAAKKAEEAKAAESSNAEQG